VLSWPELVEVQPPHRLQDQASVGVVAEAHHYDK